MIVIYPPKHYLHNPGFELFDGERVENSESPKRLESIIKTLSGKNFIKKPVTKKMSSSLLKSVHAFDYIEYLRQSPEFLGEKNKFPSVFSKINKKDLKNSINNLGLYSADTYTPLSKYTFEAAINAASCAYEGALRIKDSENSTVYALCRPPGHHASCNSMGGYCYFNNASVAAQFLSGFGKVAILDLDFHHGNGTQDIFYNRNDVFYASIHADPRLKYPYFSGYVNEKGKGKGKRFNLNIPLPLGVSNGDYQKALTGILNKLKSFGPKYLIISFGADTYEKDPIGGFCLTLDYYKTMGQTVRAAFKIPTLIVQEGGYNTDDLGKIVANFLSSFELPS